MRTMHLFAGAGGGILADKLLGHTPICAVEVNEYCQQVLAARQADGSLPWFPIFADVVEFDGRPWRGMVDVVAGGFPCQDISAAGKGVGITGARSGLWAHMARIISEVRPRYAFIENSPLLARRGLDRVLADLAAMGFDARWGIVSAAEVGAPHKRDRIWIVADSERMQVRQEPCSWSAGRVGRIREPVSWNERCFSALREFRGVDDGMAYGVERTDAIRNGQVPLVAATAWRLLGGSAFGIDGAGCI